MGEKKKKEKSAFQINLEYYPAVVFVFIIRALPLKVAYFLSEIIMELVFFFDRRHRNRTLQHILHSGIVETHREAVKLGRANFRHLGKVFVEIIKMNQIINMDNIKDYVSINVYPEFYEHFFGENSKPLIIVTGHYGNWELAGSSYSALSRIPLVSIMRPLNNPKLGNLIYSHRVGETHETVSKEKGIKPLLAALRAGKSVAIVADQHASTREGLETEFFGHPARSHATPALLHLKTGVPISVGGLRRIDDNGHFEFRGKCQIDYKPTGDKQKDVQAVTQMYTTALEDLIRERPEQWMWAHRRWLDINRKKKHKQEPEPEEKDNAETPAK